MRIGTSVALLLAGGAIAPAYGDGLGDTMRAWCSQTGTWQGSIDITDAAGHTQKVSLVSRHRCTPDGRQHVVEEDFVTPARSDYTLKVTYADASIPGFRTAYFSRGIESTHAYRFAAVELAPGAFRAQAISYVTAGGVIAGIVGPSLARFTPDLWIPLFQASFVAVVFVHILVFIILGFIEFPAVKPEDTAGPQRPLFEIVKQPAYMVACGGAIIAFGVMSFVMAASPLAIVQCGLSRTEAPITIFVHVMGMFVPSFFTGHLIARFGIFNVMTAGVAILVAGVAVALMGVTEWHFRITMTLNGLGWNFLFVGATTLLTTTYRPSERGKAQAFNDFMVFGVTTVASLMASVVLELEGWAVLNYVALTLVLVALAFITVFRLRHPSRV